MAVRGHKDKEGTRHGHHDRTPPAAKFPRPPSTHAVPRHWNIHSLSVDPGFAGNLHMDEMRAKRCLR